MSRIASMCYVSETKAPFEGLIFGGAYIRWSLSTEGNLRFKIDWASFIFGTNLPFLLCFTLYLRAIFNSTIPRGAYIWRGDLTEGFLRYRFGGLIFGGAYKWRGLFSEFYGIFMLLSVWWRFPLFEFC